MHPSLPACASLEFLLLAPEREDGLASFFQAPLANHSDNCFHPHPLSPDHARLICTRSGRDLEYAAIRRPAVPACGMLCGWRQGFSVPSLGIALPPAFRGQGLATALMHFLHLPAWLRGASQICLKVYRTNASALRLFRHLGYCFEEAQQQEIIGIIDLTHSVSGGRTT